MGCAQSECNYISKEWKKAFHFTYRIVLRRCVFVNVCERDCFVLILPSSIHHSTFYILNSFSGLDRWPNSMFHAETSKKNRSIKDTLNKVLKV